MTIFHTLKDFMCFINTVQEETIIKGSIVYNKYNQPLAQYKKDE